MKTQNKNKPIRKGPLKGSKGEWSDRVTLPEPADQNQPGSIEQQLDMVEGLPGPRGEGLIREHGRTFDDKRDPNFVKELDGDEMLQNFHVNMGESNREGDEMSGDEHSSGLQGGDSEFEKQPTFDDEMPGEETEKEEKREKRGAA
jgi:hypothetical protein